VCWDSRRQLNRINRRDIDAFGGLKAGCGAMRNASRHVAVIGKNWNFVVPVE